jgi:hypothetical protein
MDDISQAQSNFAGWNGIRANLAEMERALGELQQRVDANPQHSTSPAQHLHSTSPAQHLTSTQHSTLHAAAMHGSTIATAGDTPAAQAQLALVKQQIDELLRVRELLRESLRAVLGHCERALSVLEHGAPSLPAAAADMAASAAASGTAAASVAASEGAVASLQIDLRPSVYSGSVSLRVGPFTDISQVDTLEIALLQVPGAERVEIKEFAGRDAVAELRLYQPVRLTEELQRVLPFAFEVTGGDAASLTLLVADGGISSDTSTSAQRMRAAEHA